MRWTRPISHCSSHFWSFRIPSCTRTFAGVNTPRIRRSRVSSTVSGTAIVLRPERSRSLLLWWAALHLLLAVALLLAAPPAALMLLLGGVLALHSAWRLPGDAPPVLLRRRDGTWTVPHRGHGRLHVAAGSVLGGSWVRLVLVDQRRRLVVILLRDQFEAEVWRVLQARLRQTL